MNQRIEKEELRMRVMGVMEVESEGETRLVREVGQQVEAAAVVRATR